MENYMTDTAVRGVAVMREFHSIDGIDHGANRMLESLGDVAAITLDSRKDWSEKDIKIFFMVLLRSACQIGRSKIG